MSVLLQRYSLLSYKFNDFIMKHLRKKKNILGFQKYRYSRLHKFIFMSYLQYSLLYSENLARLLLIKPDSSYPNIAEHMVDPNQTALPTHEHNAAP